MQQAVDATRVQAERSFVTPEGPIEIATIEVKIGEREGQVIGDQAAIFRFLENVNGLLIQARCYEQ